MGRPSNRELRRLQIVQAMQAEMAETGYEHATIARVARRAGLAPGLVHYHFENKKEILMALVDHLAANLEERRLQMTVGASARERLQAFVLAHLATGQGADASAVACWVLIAAEAVRQPEVRAVYAQVVQQELNHLRGLVTASMAEAKVKATGRSRAGAIAAGILASIQGYYQLGVAVPGAVPTGTAGSTLVQFIDGVLGPVKRGSRRS